MKSTIGVYDNHELAVAAIQELKNAGFPANQISLLGHAREARELHKAIQVGRARHQVTHEGQADQRDRRPGQSGAQRAKRGRRADDA